MSSNEKDTSGKSKPTPDLEEISPSPAAAARPAPAIEEISPSPAAASKPKRDEKAAYRSQTKPATKPGVENLPAPKAAAGLETMTPAAKPKAKDEKASYRTAAPKASTPGVQNIDDAATSKKDLKKDPATAKTTSLTADEAAKQKSLKGTEAFTKALEPGDLAKAKSKEFSAKDLGGDEPPPPADDDDDIDLEPMDEAEEMMDGGVIDNAFVVYSEEEIKKKKEQKRQEAIDAQVKDLIETAPVIEGVAIEEMRPADKSRFSRRTLIIMGVSFVCLLIIIIGAAVGTRKSVEYTAAPSMSMAPSGPPTGAPTMFSQPLMTLLGPVSGEDRLVNETEPHYLAYQYMSSELDDPTSWVRKNLYRLSEEQLVERYVMILIYYGMWGEGWPEQFNFLSDDDICNWQALREYERKEYETDTKRNITGMGGVFCNGDGMVDILRLDYNNLTNSLPDEISQLSMLSAIEMGNNQITGMIPDSWYETLTNLELLVMSKNYDITGSIPSIVENLQKLRIMEFSYNQMTGSLPSELGNMANLEALGFIFNYLTGSVPDEIFKLTKLYNFLIPGNEMTGTISKAWGNMTQLGFYHIWYNQFSGTVPTELGNLVNAIELTIDDNLFTGTLPTEFGNLANIEVLHAYGNMLTGTIPTEVGKLRYCNEMQIMQNAFTGTIPTEIATMRNLKWMWLFLNELTGTLPTEIANMDKLIRISLRNNQLSGTVPAFLGDMGLTLARFERNNFTGDIPFCVDVLNADCLEPAKVTCPCCTTCCNEEECIDLTEQ